MNVADDHHTTEVTEHLKSLTALTEPLSRFNIDKNYKERVTDTECLLSLLW